MYYDAHGALCVDLNRHHNPEVQGQLLLCRCPVFLPSLPAKQVSCNLLKCMQFCRKHLDEGKVLQGPTTIGVAACRDEGVQITHVQHMEGCCSLCD